jgi:RNA polymerase sigma factor (TIGR02999 family)
MPNPSPSQVTQLLQAWGKGDAEAFDQLVPVVHAELRRIARRQMGHERAGHTLQPTALVNEAYLRLVDVRQIQWQDRAHFFAMSSRLMRRVLVDAARARGYQKRGGGAQQVFDISPDRQRFLMVKNSAAQMLTPSARDEITIVINWSEELKRLVLPKK